MGMIASLFGLAPALTRTAEVFVTNRTKQAAQEHAEQLASLSQLGAEFALPGQGWFDQMVDGLNRLPRPALALGTLALFGYAMADPVAFGIRMQGLALVPEPLWWLLGAIVSFYFGARELHHFRGATASVPVAAVRGAVDSIAQLRGADAGLPGAGVPGAGVPDMGVPDAPVTAAMADNPALAEWAATQGGPRN